VATLICVWLGMSGLPSAGRLLHQCAALIFTSQSNVISIDEAFADGAGCTHFSVRRLRSREHPRRRARTSLASNSHRRGTPHSPRENCLARGQTRWVVLCGSREPSLIFSRPPCRFMWGVGPVTRRQLARLRHIHRAASDDARLLPRAITLAALLRREADCARVESRSNGDQTHHRAQSAGSPVSARQKLLNSKFFRRHAASSLADSGR